MRGVYMNRKRRFLALMLSLIMLLCLFAGCSQHVNESPDMPPQSTGDVLNQNETPAPQPDSGKAPEKDNHVSPGETEDEDEIPFASAYTDVYEALIRTEEGPVSDAMPMPEAPEATNPPSDTSKPSTDGDHSSTNIQELGVDEGDIVKTDGENIYILSDQNLVIVSAEGTESKTLSVTQVGESWSEADENSSEGYEKFVNELYVLGDRLAVISSAYEWNESRDSDVWSYDSSERTVMELFDISDPAAPQHIAEVGQDGYPLSSRVTNGRLYLLSSYHVYDIDENDPETYIPRLYAGDHCALVPAEDILLQPENGSSFTIVTAYDMESGSLAGNQTVLGGSGTVYMNRDNLYLASTEYATEEGESYTESVYTVRDCKNFSRTNIIRFDVTDGVSIVATGSVPGYLMEQFAMDEHEGYLRVVTTLNETSYSIYEDASMGFINYQWGEDVSGNNLYILDDSLQITGSIEDLAPGEQVYSVRFDGSIGYFVTFRQVDPLFSVDLSDPTAPALLGELKIPGFSEYLHVYSSSLLFGFGMDADEETGWTETMKLSMFDVSDPVNVIERDTLVLDYYWSEALYDHNAMLIDTEKNIIGFPADSVYCLYGYSTERGFFERAEIAFDGWVSGARGIYVGDILYVISDTIHLLDLNTGAYITEIPFVF